MKVAIVGSRQYDHLDLVAQYVAQLPEGTVVLSGGALGVDQAAAAAARARGLEVHEYLPEYEKFGRQAPLLRNTIIAWESDRMVAFWDGRSRGTLDAIRKARRNRDRPIEVYGRDGKKLEEWEMPV